MGVILQAVYRFPNGNTVPSPADGNRRVPWWWDHLASSAASFRAAGFTAILLPPALKTSNGALPGAVGYNVFDDYDLGNKQQFMSAPTRYGSRERLQRCTAIMRANGIDVYLDIVMHHGTAATTLVTLTWAPMVKRARARSPNTRPASFPTFLAIPLPDPFPTTFPSETNWRR